MNKKERVAALKERLLSDDTFLIESLINLYKLQTDDEKRSKETYEENGVGFNSTDSKVLTSISEFYLERNFLSPKQKDLVRKKIVKYANQLRRLEEGEISL